MLGWWWGVCVCVKCCHAALRSDVAADPADFHFLCFDKKKWFWRQQMCVGVVKERCVVIIIIIISWLWWRGRLAAEQSHLVNETWVCWSNETAAPDEQQREKEEMERRGESDARRKWDPHWCRRANEVLVVSITSSHPVLLLALPLPPARILTVHQAAALRRQLSRSQIPLFFFTQKSLSGSARLSPTCFTEMGELVSAGGFGRVINKK